MPPLHHTPMIHPVGSVGVEPTPQRLKDVYAAITPRPRACEDATFEAKQPSHDSSPIARSRSFRAVGREALESSSAVLQTAANPSQLPAQTKRPGIFVVTPGLASFLKKKLGVTSAEDERGGPSPIDQPDARPICVSLESRDTSSLLSRERTTAIRDWDRSSSHLNRRS